MIEIKNCNQAKKIPVVKCTSKWSIDKKFLPLKLALFFYYAGSFSTYAFVPVFLKHQGLTIVHLSIFTAMSVCTQFSGGIFFGFLADKIGRIKPFWFFFLGLYCLSTVCFTTIPSVTKCDVENAFFECYNKEMLNLTANSCQIIGNNTRDILCSEISVNYGINSVNQNETSRFMVTLIPKFDLNLDKNLSGVYWLASDCTNCSFKNISQCTSDICESLQFDCSVYFLDCNENAKFWVVIYGILVILHDFARTNVFRINDIIASDLSFESNSDFGRQRMCGILGGMVGPFLVGIILNAINGSNEIEKSYTWVFVCAIIFSTLSAFSMRFVNPKFHKPASKMWKKSFELVKNLDIMLFVALLVTMGSVFGFRGTYRNWYLKDLGASDLLTGIISGVSNLYGIPILYNSAWWINKIGVRNVFILGLLGHVVYSFSFSVLREPWVAVIIELTSILFYHLFWIAAIQYAHVVSPEGLVAFMKSLAGGLHYNIGKFGSTFVAGFVMNTYGGRAAFIVLGCIALAYLLFYGSYLMIHYLKQRKKRTSLESVGDKEIPGKEPNFL